MLSSAKQSPAPKQRLARRQHTEEDFTNDLLPVIQRHPHIFIQEAMTLAAFRTAASWVGSRAFGINRYHGVH